MSKTSYTVPDLYNTKDPLVLMDALQKAPEHFEAYSVWSNAANVACQLRHVPLTVALANHPSQSNLPHNEVRTAFHVLRFMMGCNDQHDTHFEPEHTGFVYQLLQQDIFLNAIRSPSRINIFVSEEPDPLMGMVEDLNRWAGAEFLHALLSKLDDDMYKACLHRLSFGVCDMLLTWDQTGRIYEHLHQELGTNSDQKLIKVYGVSNFVQHRQVYQHKQQLLDVVTAKPSTGSKPWKM